MRLRLRHTLNFTFAEPARSLTHLLRLTPRSHEGQRITKWRIEVSPDCLLKAGEDHFGNLTHTLTVPGVIGTLAITVHGEIVNFDAAGVVRGAAERLPAELYLRDTPLTAPTPAIRAFADNVVAGGTDRLGKLHRLMEALFDRIGGEAATDRQATAAEAFEMRHESWQGQAHLFVACARHLGCPARCITGYLAPDEGHHRRHAWAEVQVDNLGWVAFDPAHNICPQDQHIRMALGLDTLDAAAIRGTRLDGLDETLKVSWLLKREPAPAMAQMQAAT